MEGFIDMKIAPWKTRLATRLLAVIPAVIIIVIGGSQETGDLLILSQVLLSIQLPFAVVPLIHFVSSSRLMGRYVIGNFTKTASWVIAFIIILLNIKLVFDIADTQLESGIFLLGYFLYALLIAALIFLGYIFYYPIKNRKNIK